ncbi:PLAC8 protein, partial [Dicaeum eximium]|nr:PLAC8 protein [Dicaeum eximium]
LAMASEAVITVQPQFAAAQQPGQWQTGLLDVCSDCGVCLCGMFCFPCLAGQVASDMGECCLCGSSVAMRTLYRTRYNIPGSIMGDFCSVRCLAPCALCQLKRDINQRKAMGTF